MQIKIHLRNDTRQQLYERLQQAYTTRGYLRLIKRIRALLCIADDRIARSIVSGRQTPLSHGLNRRSSAGNSMRCVLSCLALRGFIRPATRLLSWVR